MLTTVSSENGVAAHVLIVDDDADVVKAAVLLLSRYGMKVSGAADPLEARSFLAAERVDVVLLDLNFTRGATSGEEGLQCLRQLLIDDAQTVVVVVTAHSGINVAVRAMQAGARDFVIKPWNNARLLATVQDALQARRSEVSKAEARVSADEPEPILLGESLAMQRVASLIARAGPTDAPVLITGDAGTGKNLVARRLHLASSRAGHPIRNVDVAALGSEAAECALFGDGLGGLGALSEAAGGTLILDEPADLSATTQARLRAELERGIGPRLISTSRRSGEVLGGRGGLRDDLLYLLSTVEIALPPLSARESDPLLLGEYFLRRFERRHGRAHLALSPAARTAVLAAPWPGGVRALAQTMERAVIFAERNE